MTKPHTAIKRCRHLALHVFCAFYLAFGSPHGAFAQDLKSPIAILAARIATSGRKTVAVVDFTDLEGNPTRLGRFLAEEVSVDLVEVAKGYDVIDRTRLNVLLQEHRLAARGLIDPQTAKKLGQIAGADALVTGIMTPLGETVRVALKVLDTDTAKTIAAITIDIPKTPAIATLLNESGTVAQVDKQGGAPSSPPTADNPLKTVDQDQLLFAVRKCQRSGTVLTCSGFIKNEAQKLNPIGNSSPVVIDDLGEQYTATYGTFRFGDSPFQQDLEPDLPVNFSFAVRDVNSGATRVTVILAGWIQNEGSFKTTLRNIPLSQK